MDQETGNWYLFNDNTISDYNIKTDLGLANTGSFDGWILIDSNSDNVYITLFNDDFGLAAFHYNDTFLKVGNYIKKKEIKLIMCD